MNCIVCKQIDRTNALLERDEKTASAAQKDLKYHSVILSFLKYRTSK